MPAPVLKVYAYITRPGPSGTELLVFESVEPPLPGLEVPGGTVDPGESLEAALLREVWEESGLRRLLVLSCLGSYPCRCGDVLYQRHFFHAPAPAALPEEWEHRVTAGEDDCGFLFRYRWIPLATAAGGLTHALDGALPALR